MKSVLLIFLKQLTIFLCYFAVSALVLFNHEGGTDILFAGMVTFFSIIHLIVLVVKLFKEKQAIWGIISLIIIATIFFTTLDAFMRLMWRWTNG